MLPYCGQPLKNSLHITLSEVYSPTYALSKASGEVIAKQITVTAIPRRFNYADARKYGICSYSCLVVADIAPNAYQKIHVFRAAYDFILLREQAGEDLAGLGDWWTQYQEADEEQKTENVRVTRQHW